MSQAAPSDDAHGKERSAVEQVFANKSYVDNPELLPWYMKDLDNLKPAARDLFENYSKVPSHEVIPHITKVRDQAFKTVVGPPQDYMVQQQLR